MRKFLFIVINTLLIIGTGGLWLIPLALYMYVNRNKSR